MGILGFSWYSSLVVYVWALGWGLMILSVVGVGWICVCWVSLWMIVWGSLLITIYLNCFFLEFLLVGVTWEFRLTVGFVVTVLGGVYGLPVVLFVF